MEYQKKAIEKLENEAKGKMSGNKENAMKKCSACGAERVLRAGRRIRAGGCPGRQLVAAVDVDSIIEVHIGEKVNGK